MQPNVFEAELKTAGYTQIEAKALDLRPANAEHAHDYDVWGLVLDGIFVVNQDDVPTTYHAGDVFAVSAGKGHSEEVGPNGAHILAGRRYR